MWKYAHKKMKYVYEIMSRVRLGECERYLKSGGQGGAQAPGPPLDPLVGLNLVPWETEVRLLCRPTSAVSLFPFM